MEFYNGQIEKSSKENTRPQDAGRRGDNFIKTNPVRKAAIVARKKINDLMKNNAVTVLFSYI